MSALRRAELTEVVRRVEADRAELERERVWVFAVHVHQEHVGPPFVVAELAAPTEIHAADVLRRRYGVVFDIDWLAETPVVEEARPWHRYELIGDRELRVRYGTWEQGSPSHVRVVEDADTVEITIYDLLPPYGLELAPSTTRTATVSLRSPLGKRRIVDGGRIHPFTDEQQDQ